MSDDLVQRLREQGEKHWPYLHSCLEYEAADRIEALEKRWDLQVDDAVRMAAERTSQLEAALREISARVIRFTYQGPSLMELDGIARRALERKS